MHCQWINQKNGKFCEDKDFKQFHGKGLWEEMKKIPIHLFREGDEDWESLQLKSTEDGHFSVALTAKYEGLKFHDIDGPLNAFSSAVNGFTLENTAVYFGN